VAGFFSKFLSGDARPPVRRVLAVDAGQRCLKLLLAQTDFGRLRIVKEELVDLQAEGLVSADELKSHLQTRLEELGHPSVAMALPEHVSTSLVVDLPLAPESEVEKLIADEIVKVGGVSETRICHDFVRTESQVKNRQQFWVTLCREGDIRERIQRLGVEQEDLCEVTTVANALIAAYRSACPLSSRAVLVHLGAQTTVVVVLLAGQGVFATSFQMGGDFFTRAIARLRSGTEAAAEALKREHDFLTGPEASTEFASVVDGWVAELKRQLQEWFQRDQRAAADAKQFDLIASGQAFDQPGLLEYLERKAGLALKPWPKPNQPDAVAPGKGFEVAYGLALQALGFTAQPVSLLPEDYERLRQKRVGRQRVEMGNLILLAICALLLVFGAWYKLSVGREKQALQDKVRSGQETFEANEALTIELLSEYDNLRPIFASQQNSIDILKTLSLLQQARSNRSLWYVLIADQQSYFSGPPVALATNRPALTNLIGPALELTRPAALTNSGLSKPGLIVELCVPGDVEAARLIFSELVKDLKQQPLLFSQVDLLSDDLRRGLADPKVVIPNHWVVHLDFAETELQLRLPYKKQTATTTRGGEPRRTPRPSWTAPAAGQKPLPTTP